MEAYKVSKECNQEKLAFAEPSFVEGMDDTRRRVITCYPFLNLVILDENSGDDAFTVDAPTP